MFSPSRMLLQIQPLKPKEGIAGVVSSQRLVQSCVFCFPLASLTATGVSLGSALSSAAESEPMMSLESLTI